MSIITTLGLDLGAIAIKAVFASHASHPDKTTINSIYRIHKGKPEEVISGIIKDFGSQIDRVAITGSIGRRIAGSLKVTYVDPAVALVAAADGYADIRHIIDIGGGSLSVVDLDEEGRFSSFRTNSLCAAGTGSFLDEQAIRMGLTLKEMSTEIPNDDPPRIAARCSVFAKSDLIHRQQEGFSIEEMWSGLCKGMVATAISTLFRGRRPKGKVLFVGGVALNREVIKWLGRLIDAELIIPEKPEVFSAVGLLRAATKPKEAIDWNSLATHLAHKLKERRPTLELELTNYPSFDCKKAYLDEDTEIRIHKDIRGDVVLGIDIGSTSTKSVILNSEGEVCADLYRRTKGDPIGAVQKLMRLVTALQSNYGFNICGAGTTGSGRKMIGAIIGADRIINEITAHAKGAIVTDPKTETIFEIGGQDAKFISLKNGMPHDSNMNYVCAAGTGSFVEEQAGKLAFKLEEIGENVMGTTPPYSSDRCTVFMEQDVHALIREGFERNEIMGSVLYSVTQNYLNRVVGRRPYSRNHISFMGATARNKGLVAAFEKLLGTSISVSPYCHVMGAFGVAEIVLEEVVKNKIATTFKGLSLADKEIHLRREICDLCSNNCTITHAQIDKDEAASGSSWGYLCGRDPEEMSVRTSTHFNFFRKQTRIWQKYTRSGINHNAPTFGGQAPTIGGQAPTIGIPRSLLFYSYLPLWTKFFDTLGIKVILSRPTVEKTIEDASEWIGSDYCYPVKLAHGHVRDLVLNDHVKNIFLPYVVLGEPHDDEFKRSVFCPYNIAFPSVIKQSGMLDEEDKHMIAAVINFQHSHELVATRLYNSLKKHYAMDKKSVEKAWAEALGAQDKYQEECLGLGDEALSSIKDKDAVVILGRPYNIYDQGANLGLPQKIADQDLTVLTVDMLPLKNVGVDPIFKNMYWRYGRKILQAATFVANHPKLHAIYLTNFGCGPDSFLQSFVERIMHGKPMLMLELDEHSADAGYITRLEAFRDVINKEGCKKIASGKPTAKRQLKPYRTLWIPPLHPYGAEMLAAVIRSNGQDARMLKTESLETFEIAKRYCRGTECVPLPSTIGAFINVLKKSDNPELECFFMPSARGPCRFGQYHTLHRMILNEAGYPNTQIESWDDESGSYGTDTKTSQQLFSAFVAADLLFKARCRMRPYVKDVPNFDELMQTLLNKTVQTVENKGNLKTTLKEISNTLLRVEKTGRAKPLVGIVGEIYVRLNSYTNGRLIEVIEDAGGEAWVAPVTEWFNYLSLLDKMRGKEENYPLKRRLKLSIKKAYMYHKEKWLTSAIKPIIGDRLEPPIKSTLAAGERYFPREFDGESIMTVGRAIKFAEQGVDLIINCAPFGCMPGTLTSGIFQKLEGTLKTPIVSLFFDGETDLSHLVHTYLENIRRA